MTRDQFDYQRRDRIVTALRSHAIEIKAAQQKQLQFG
jgi:hypothetical protein